MAVIYTTPIRQSTSVLAQTFSWSQPIDHHLVLVIHMRTLDFIAYEDFTCFSQVEVDAVAVGRFAESEAAGA